LFSQKKTRPNSRLPSLYSETLIKAEFDYRREIRHKLEQLQHDNRDAVRRRLASDYLFAKCHLKKRHQWFTIDKSYRDACRTTWNREYAASGRTSHVFLPNVYPSENSSPLSMESFNTLGSRDKDENPAATNERIKQDFLRVQPVMLELLRAPHSSKALKYKYEVEIRKKSAQKRQIYIQTTARSDNRYTELVDSLQEF
jgi:hypothetical protein